MKKDKYRISRTLPSNRQFRKTQVIRKEYLENNTKSPFSFRVLCNMLFAFIL